MISKSAHLHNPVFGSSAYNQQARLACTTAWIASPAETVDLLDELAAHTAEERVTWEKKHEDLEPVKRNFVYF